ncbi:MAG: RecQ family ATP-dependent DNA helicase [Lactobacillaceae bacterium]|jgi:ATP-dependent DNA helicase RecQ|nr:RecQ family ATP-dependent DNA helicase [Lactobacillaceae bacterium]
MNERLEQVLADNFGFTSFKPGQSEIIEALLAGKNTVALLPTGGGKSLIYQMIGEMREGLVIVVTPLLSLMQDQVARLNYSGERRVVALNSNLTRAERETILNTLHQYQFLFISPEMLGERAVISALQRIKLNLLVVDEAHIIASWGPDFRPEYLNLPQIHQQLGRPQLLMLTATATHAVLEKIIAPFNLPKEQMFLYQQSVDRANIYLHNERFENEQQKQKSLLTLVQQLQGPGIIYFSSRRKATQMAQWLSSETGLRVMDYHAGLDNQDRYRIQHQFMLGQIDLVTATSAFGMGLDKADVRYVIHYQLSSDLANYLQEFGRAGRDGQTSAAILLYAQGDEFLQTAMINLTLPTEQAIIKMIDGHADADEIGQQQFDLINFYRQKGYSKRQITEMFERRRGQRLSGLRQLVEYAQLKSGLRAFLLSAFENSHSFDHEFESVGSDWSLEEIGLEKKDQSIKIHSDLPQWNEQIGKLFNLR